MNLYKKNNRRLTLRRRWRGKIIFEDEFGEGLIYLYSKDISLGGLYLENPPPLRLGAQLLLSFALPGNKRPLKLTGELVRFVEHAMNGSGKVRAGAGVRFVDMDSESFKQLSQFIKG